MNFLRKIYHYTLALIGAVLYGFSSKNIFVVGVTGTNGKTTVVELIAHILKTADKKVVFLSSGNSTENTMPGRFFIQRFLSRAVKSGHQYAIIEVTSEGVKLNRHRFIDWNAAMFLNLSPEHIESHGSFEKYREAKLNFFRYANKKTGVLNFLNKDDENVKYFIESAKSGKVIMFGKSEFDSELVGDFNKYNIGAAAAFARSQDIAPDIIEKAVMSFSGVAGRMEFIQKEPFAVVVDYAHTPDSLRQVYKSIRPGLRPAVTKAMAGKQGFGGQGRLICVLGSAGGGRDKWKRPEIGKIAAEYCDEIILTDEDPYDENPEDIINEIAATCPKAQKIIDRKEAIKKAVSLAKEGDPAFAKGYGGRSVVIITGKGSEKFIHKAKGKKIPWSDKETVLDVL